MMRKSKYGPFALQRLVCRHLTIAAMMLQKWVEWRYGRAKETVEVMGQVEHVLTEAEKQAADAAIKTILAEDSRSETPLVGEFVEEGED